MLFRFPRICPIRFPASKVMLFRFSRICVFRFAAAKAALFRFPRICPIRLTAVKAALFRFSRICPIRLAAAKAALFASRFVLLYLLHVTPRFIRIIPQTGCEVHRKNKNYADRPRRA